MYVYPIQRHFPRKLKVSQPFCNADYAIHSTLHGLCMYIYKNSRRTVRKYVSNASEFTKRGSRRKGDATIEKRKIKTRVKKKYHLSQRTPVPLTPFASLSLCFSHIFLLVVL